MFQNLGIEEGVENRVQSVTQINYGPLIEEMVELGILKEKIAISSSKQVGPLLLKLYEEFLKDPDVSNRTKQEFFIRACDEHLGMPTAFR